MRRAIVLVATLSMLAAACTKVESPPESSSEPDRVVGIELKCDIVYFNEVRRVELTGWDICSDWGQQRGAAVGAVNLRKELTVRTYSGETYRVSYGAEHDAWLGMEWPPK
mgnify:CR=1 FL=1